jgi:hypothetical protein
MPSRDLKCRLSLVSIAESYPAAARFALLKAALFDAMPGAK